MIGFMISLSPPPRLRVVFSYWLMLKVLAPIDAKSEEIVFSKAETTVRILTKAVIPIAIINTVRTVLNNCVLMEPNAIRIFSLNNFNIIAVWHENTIFVTNFLFKNPNLFFRSFFLFIQVFRRLVNGFFKSFFVLYYFFKNIFIGTSYDFRS